MLLQYSQTFWNLMTSVFVDEVVNIFTVNAINQYFKAF